MGAPRGWGGPWCNSTVLANEPSDPYLMAGYLHKKLALSHTEQRKITFDVEVDFLANGTWVHYTTIDVRASTTVEHLFPQGYSAHWVRLVAKDNATTTAIFHYN
ncbi:hypothetical protein ACFSTH_12615 [Paenibacillus yanchengensis]|uniref:Uncharacterized protein n=1 Tax=Paenibacillus yanchengensis TaxID=2035833 RepID=A0ABW4YI45_9BACL